MVRGLKSRIREVDVFEYAKMFSHDVDHTQLPSSNWSSYIFTLVQKVKVGHTKFTLLRINRGFAETLQVISFKNDLYFLHRRSQNKGTLISKSHAFSTI